MLLLEINVEENLWEIEALRSVCKHDEALSWVNKGYSPSANHSLRAKTRKEAFRDPQCIAYQVRFIKVNHEWRRALWKSMQVLLRLKNSCQTKQTVICISQHITRTRFKCIRLWDEQSDIDDCRSPTVSLQKEDRKESGGTAEKSTKLGQTLFWKPLQFKAQTLNSSGVFGVWARSKDVSAESDERTSTKSIGDNVEMFIPALTGTRTYKQEHEKSAFSFPECELVAFSYIFHLFPWNKKQCSTTQAYRPRAGADSERLLNSHTNIYCSNFFKLHFFSTEHNEGVGDRGDGNKDWQDAFERLSSNLRCSRQMTSVRRKAGKSWTPVNGDFNAQNRHLWF